MADTEKHYDFKYLPLEGKLPGKSFERQTEDAINDLGDIVIQVEESSGETSDLAEKAYQKAVEAETTADTALSAAQNAQAAADNAQSTADSAEAKANAAQTAADNAQLTADTANQNATEAKTAAEVAQTDAAEALQTANTAQKDASAAQLTADTALSAANANSESIANLSQEVDELRDYTNVGNLVDLNDYYYEHRRLYVDADAGNTPTDTEKFFVDVDVETGMEQVRQLATGAASGTIYIRYGSLTEIEDETEPEPDTEEGAGEGTLVVNGDVSADVKIRGNVEVTGEISGNVEATGTITYGTLTGTATENAELDEVDIAVDAGTVLIKDGDLYTDEDGVLATNSSLYPNSSDADVTIYSDMNLTETKNKGDEAAIKVTTGKVTIPEGVTVNARGEDTSENYGTYIGAGELIVAGTLNTAGTTATDFNTGVYVGSNGKFTVTETGEVNTSCAEDVEEKNNCYSIWTNSSDAVINVDGVINADGVINIRGEFTGSGKVYNDGEIYYDGSALEPTNGVLVITGDLNADITVNGSVEVTGTISGNVTATGSVTYGELTGTVNENASIEECDLQIADGTVTIDGDVDENYATDGKVTNAATTTIECSLTSTEFENTGALTVNGAVVADSWSNEGTIDGTGTVTVDGVVIYDGDDHGYVVLWGDWTEQSGSGNVTDIAIQMTAAIPNCYRRAQLMESNKTTITVFANTQVNIDGSGYVSTEDTVLSLDDVLDAEERAGTDMYVYACKPTRGSKPVFVVSPNSTVPDGYDADNSRKIGGFHCLCADVGDIDGHELSGYFRGEILPRSVWDLIHRAQSENEGMVWIEEVGAWVDIYHASWDGEKLVSVYGGEVVRGTRSSKIMHGEMLAEELGLVKKRMMYRDEFVVLAKGSNENTNIKNDTDPTTAGGHEDTNSRRMISNYGVEDCCGAFYQWVRDIFGVGNSAAMVRNGNDLSASGCSWVTNVSYESTIDGSNRYGNWYGCICRILVGGAYGTDDANCGSRCVAVNGFSSYVYTHYGSRGASGPRAGYLN